MDLSDRLNEIKNCLGLTNKDLAKKLGVTRQALDKINRRETKNPRGSFFVLFKNEIGVEPTWFLTGEGQMFKTPEDCEERANRLQSDVDFLRKEVNALKQLMSVQEDKIKRLESDKNLLLLSLKKHNVCYLISSCVFSDDTRMTHANYWLA